MASLKDKASSGDAWISNTYKDYQERLAAEAQTPSSAPELKLGVVLTRGSSEATAPKTVKFRAYDFGHLKAFLAKTVYLTGTDTVVTTYFHPEYLSDEIVNDVASYESMKEALSDPLFVSHRHIVSIKVADPQKPEQQPDPMSVWLWDNLTPVQRAEAAKQAEAEAAARKAQPHALSGSTGEPDPIHAYKSLIRQCFPVLFFATSILLDLVL